MYTSLIHILSSIRRWTICTTSSSFAFPWDLLTASLPNVRASCASQLIIFLVLTGPTPDSNSELKLRVSKRIVRFKRLCFAGASFEPSRRTSLPQAFLRTALWQNLSSMVKVYTAPQNCGKRLLIRRMAYGRAAKDLTHFLSKSAQNHLELLVDLLHVS